MRSRPVLVLVLVSVLVPVPVSADPVARPRVVRLQPRSLRVTTEGVVVRVRADPEAPRRGLLARGARVPYMGEVRAPGCEAPWYRVDPEGYACGDLLEPTREERAASKLPVLAEGRLLPFEYGYARGDGARVYVRPEDVSADDWDHELDAGFGIALDRPLLVDGLRMWRTRRGNFIHASDIAVAHPSEFAGVVIEPGAATAYAWARRAEAFARPIDRARRTPPVVVGRQTAVPVLEERRVGGALRLRISDEPGAVWLDSRDVRRTTPASRPEGVGERERWIDVDRSEQVLVAYEGDRPVFATLVSTGRALASTPPGVHRVWVKLATSAMDNFEDEEAEELYSLEEVPWVLYFAEGVAIHGTFWHDRFGERRSHGCVNVSVRDARWLYEFIGPAAPDGWSAVFPTERVPGTVVRVR